MNTPTTPFALPPQTAHLPFPYRPEAQALAEARQRLGAGLDWQRVVAAATPWLSITPPSARPATTTEAARKPAFSRTNT